MSRIARVSLVAEVGKEEHVSVVHWLGPALVTQAVTTVPSATNQISAELKFDPLVVLK